MAELVCVASSAVLSFPARLLLRHTQLVSSVDLTICYLMKPTGRQPTVCVFLCALCCTAVRRERRLYAADNKCQLNPKKSPQDQQSTSDRERTKAQSPASGVRHISLY